MPDPGSMIDASRRKIWMVVRGGLDGPATFGPFTHDEAVAHVEDSKRSFEASGYVGQPGRVVNYEQNRRSPCGPWLP